MIAQQKEKGKSKSGKGENITLQHLHAAHAEYEEEATLCAFRLKSLKQGQSRSLLTQAARHHAAQVLLNFRPFSFKSLRSLLGLVLMYLFLLFYFKSS
jgi:HD-like signal output (HDOD) protein